MSVELKAPKLEAVIKEATAAIRDGVSSLRIGLGVLEQALDANTAATNDNTAATDSHRIALEANSELLRQIVVILSPHPAPPNPVGPFTARQTGEAEMLIYELDLPSLPDVPAAKDVVKGEVTLAFDGVEQTVIETGVGQIVVTDVKIEQGVAVTGSFAFVDDAGNKSVDPTELTPFTTSDTTPPPDAVGGFGARQVGEE